MFRKHKSIFAKIFKIYGVGDGSYATNKQSKTGRSKANDMAGEYLSLEYRQGNAHYHKAFF